MTSGAGLDCLRILSETVSSDSPRMPRLRHGIRPILFKCFKAFTISLQNGALWSLRRLMAQEADPPDPCQMLEILYKSFTKRSILEPRAPHGSGGQLSDPFQMLQILYKPFTKRSILEPRAPRGSGARSAKCFPNASNPLQILYKTEHFGTSGASCLRRPIQQILFKCFKSFTNPLQNGAFWSLGRPVAQELDPPSAFQMLQTLYKSFTKLSTLELRAPHGSGGRSGKSFSNASNPLQTLYKT